MKSLKYFGEFLTRKNILVRAEIHQEGNFLPSEFHFAEDAIEIKWDSDGKMANIHSSGATLTLFSDNDRRFVDLYQVEVGAVLLKVFRAGKLYWSGTLDTELYEEPYAYNEGYDVTLTFSDFAPLSRKKFSGVGYKTFDEIINDCLTSSEISFNGVEKYISTKLSSYGSPIDLAELAVACANFYDEDGEPMELLAVLEETLKPLALHIIQKAGKVYIFDLNALAAKNAVQIYWASTDSNLSVDTTYNNVKLTFSPYGETKIIEAKLDEKKTATDATFSTTIFVDYEQADIGSGFKNPAGFKIFVGNKSEEGEIVQGTGQFYRIEAEYSGSDEAGMVYVAQATTAGGEQSNYIPLTKNPRAKSALKNGAPTSQMLFKTKPKQITPHGSYSGDYKLKVTLDALIDVRYNPFEQEGDNNESGLWKDFQNEANFAYVPVKIVLRDANGVAIMHYRNKQTFESTSYKQIGSWLAGEGDFAECWLAFYDNNRKSATGLGGWKKNKPCIGWFAGELPSNLTRLGDGEYLPMPSMSGFLEIQVGDGIYMYDNDRHIERDLYPFIRWQMYKNPTVEIVKRNGLSYNVEDVELNAWINSNAKEELAINTIIGTLSKTSPSARGQMLGKQGEYYSPITTLSRAGIVDLPEKLLLGTAYSCYANRYATLSGTARLIPTFEILSDANTAGKYFVSSESQNLAEEESSITVVEFEADNYEGIRYE